MKHWKRLRNLQPVGLLILLCLVAGCQPTESQQNNPPGVRAELPSLAPGERVGLGSELLLRKYLPLLQGKRIGLLAHPASRLPCGVHLLDTLHALAQQPQHDFDLVRIFAPEHGLRTWREAGAAVADEHDTATGLPVVSLYGQRKAPEPTHLQDLDVLLVDLQDVGVRYYTYFSALTFTLEACAKAQVAVWVLDRPNPLGGVVAGPVRHPDLQSYVGLHPLPLWHGLSIGEFTRMAVGEQWVFPAPEFRVLPCTGWRHGLRWDSTGLPWFSPSPNLPTVHSAECYGLLGWLEGTRASVGRGTPEPFTVMGFPEYQSMEYRWKKDSLDQDTTTYRFYGLRAQPARFTPQAKPGYANKPKFQGDTCWGVHLLQVPLHPDSLSLAALQLLLNAWNEHHEAFEEQANPPRFFQPFFHKLSGDPQLVRRILAGETNPHKLAAEWSTALGRYRRKRLRYLLYPD